MIILKSKIKIGLEKKIGFLHITDSHLPSESEEHQKIRIKAENAMKEALEYADENGLIVIHTGDMMTFFNDKNFDFIDKNFGKRDYIFTAGNHDFCDEGEMGNNPENVEKHMKEIAPHFRDNLFFSSGIINGLNIVCIFDSYFRITEDQIEKLKNEVKKGYPILLCMHVPVFSQEHAAARMAVNGCAHLLGPTEEFFSRYNEGCRFQIADETTLRAIEYIKNEPAVKAIVAGHTHLNIEETLEGNTVQIVTGCTMDGYAREIIVE